MRTPCIPSLNQTYVFPCPKQRRVRTSTRASDKFCRLTILENTCDRAQGFLDKWYNHNQRVCKCRMLPNPIRCKSVLVLHDVPNHDRVCSSYLFPIQHGTRYILYIRFRPFHKLLQRQQSNCSEYVRSRQWLYMSYMCNRHVYKCHMFPNPVRCKSHLFCRDVQGHDQAPLYQFVQR